jgi:hypothetical protein
LKKSLPPRQLQKVESALKLIRRHLMVDCIEQMIVEEKRAARAFATARPRAILFALMQSEHSLQGLQTSLGFSLSLLHYHVSRMLALGLLRVVRREARAGSTIAIYAAAARSFLVPAHLEADTPGASLADELQAALERARLRCSAAGTVYFLDEQRVPKMRRMAEAGPADEGEHWWRLCMSEAEAKSLVRDIRALVTRHRDRGAPPGQEYLCHFAIGRS